MNFELWLFTIKKLAQNMEVAKLIYDGLDSEAQKELQKEYRAYIGEPDEPQIVQTAGRDSLGDFAPAFAHFNDDVLFGENWNNPDIDLKTRSIITVVALIAQGITDSSLKYHISNAKEHGVTQKEIAAVITHTAFYAGWPKAWAAFRIAQEVYEKS
jgi:4-carboxymuconolactone decarboxylase